MSTTKRRLIAEEFRRLRLASGMTMEQLAHLAGVTYQTVYRMESKRQNFNPKLNTVYAIARALGKEVKIEFVAWK